MSELRFKRPGEGPAMRTPREYARWTAADGLGLLARAVNYFDDTELPYRFADKARDRFKQLAIEIVELIAEGEIVELPHVVARNDPRFQVFMGAMLEPPKKQRKRQRGAPS